jgi:hypothetical protein
MHPPPQVGIFRRAGILQIVLSSLSLLCGACLSAVSPMLTPELLAQQGRAIPPGLDFDMFRTIVLISGIVLGASGLILVVLGVFVLRGSRAAIITSIVLVILGIVLQLINMIGQFSAGGSQAVGGLLNLVVAGILTWLVIWLFQANSAAGQLAGGAAAMMSQQQQFPYGYQGYGYPPPNQQWPNQPQWPAQQPPPSPQQQQQQWPPPPANPPSS